MPKFLFLLLISFTSFAQVQKGQIEYLEDKAGLMGIESVVNSKSFKFSKTKIPSLGITTHPVWTRLIVKNTEANPKIFYAQMILPYMDTVQYFVIKDNLLASKSEKMGWWSNISNKHLNSPNHPFEFSLDAHETVLVYARSIKTHGTLRVPFQINTEEDFLEDLYTKNIFYGWFLGMIFLMVLLNIFMYLLMWEKVYLAYTLYVICQTWAFILREGFHSQVFNRGFGPITGLNFYYLGLILMAISSLVFIHSLLRSKSLQPKTINFFFWFFLVFALLLAAMQFLPSEIYNVNKSRHYTMALTCSYLGSLGLLFFMVFFAIFKNKERQSAILYAISGIPLITLSFVQILGNMQVFPINTAYRGVYSIFALAFEMIVLCYWLALRFKQFSNDRETLLIEKANQQKIALETGLQLQYEERARLAKELHDGIGIDISIIKMKLEALSIDLEKKGNLAKEFHETIANLDNVASNIRSFSHNIMPADLEKSGITAVLENLVYNLDKLNSNIELNFTSNIKEKLGDDISQNLYFITKELINNALKHSKASIIDVELLAQNNQLELIVSDNGIAYDTNAMSSQNGFGLQSIRSRVELIKGHFDVIIKSSGGVLHKIIIPKFDISKTSN